MPNDKDDILKRIRSAQTWDRAEWWMRIKGGAEAKEARGVIKPEDYLPIMLGFIKRFVMILPVGLLLWLSWKINIIMFYVFLGISIPLSLGVAHLLDYLISKYIATEK